MRSAAELPHQLDAPEMVTYEQPLNERMRTFLRLNFLFNQAEFHAHGSSSWQSRAAVDSLLDALAILGRGDVRQEVIKDLERHTQDLIQFQSQPGVDKERLADLLGENRRILKALEVAQVGLTQVLKDSNFLNSVKHRSAIPGGTCEFDLPDYRHWLELSFDQRSRDFSHWMESLKPVRDGIGKLLWLTRESAAPTSEVARAGMFQHVLSRGVAAQLLRVSVAASLNIFPEISGSQHRFTVRFQTWLDIDQRPTQATDDIKFLLACC